MEGLDPIRGTYRTPRRHLSAFAQVSPSLRFYSQFASLVTRSAHKAIEGSYDDAQWEGSSRHTLRMLEAAGLRVSADGLHHLSEADGPYMIVGNHMSMLETVVLPSLVRPFLPVTFVVKDDLVSMPVFRHVMLTRDPIVVTRRDPRADFQTMMKGGVERLGKGISIIVFPQTTRIVAFIRSQFNSIGVKVARKAGVPVIPFALKTDAWSISKRFVKDLGRIDPKKPVRFAFGEPIEVTGRGEEAQRRCVDFIESHLESWGIPVSR